MHVKSLKTHSLRERGHARSHIGIVGDYLRTLQPMRRGTHVAWRGRDV